jgi:hypothetical protein
MGMNPQGGPHSGRVPVRDERQGARLIPNDLRVLSGRRVSGLRVLSGLRLRDLSVLSGPNSMFSVASHSSLNTTIGSTRDAAPCVPGGLESGRRRLWRPLRSSLSLPRRTTAICHERPKGIGRHLTTTANLRATRTASTQRTPPRPSRAESRTSIRVACAAVRAACW